VPRHRKRKLVAIQQPSGEGRGARFAACFETPGASAVLLAPGLRKPDTASPTMTHNSEPLRSDDRSPAHVASGVSVSRRSLLMNTIVSAATIATAAAIASPSIAQASVTEPAAAKADTKISELMKARSRARRNSNRLGARADFLNKELLRRLPAPHPSIVYGLKENDDDGLVYWVPDREAHTINKYIEPDTIEFRVEQVGFVETWSRDEEGHVVSSWSEKPAPLTEDDLARKARLEARLKLAEAYKEQIDRLRAELGIDELRARAEEWTSECASLECEIFRQPAMCISDLGAKMSLYDRTGHCIESADDILRDLRRLLRHEQPTPLFFG
jgi:hypothetical protein